MNAVVSVASVATAVAVSSPSIANAPGDHNDLAAPHGDIDRIFQEMVVLERDLQRTYDRLSDCEEAYNEIRPDMPAVLRWKFADPVRRSLFAIDRHGRRDFWCDFGDIQRKRNKTWLKHEFFGTDDDLSLMGLTSEQTVDAPVAGFENLFRSSPDEFHQKRMAELVAAMDGYVAADQAAMAESGLETAEREVDDLWARQNALFRNIIEIEATCMTDLAVQMKALLIYRQDEVIHESNNASLDEKMLNCVIARLTGVAVVQG